MSTVFHIGPSGPGRCTGGTGQIRPKGCLYANSFHGTLEECESVIEKQHDSARDLHERLILTMESNPDMDYAELEHELREEFNDHLLEDYGNADFIKNQLFEKYYNPETDILNVSEEEFKRELYREWSLAGINPLVSGLQHEESLFEEFIHKEEDGNLLIKADTGDDVAFFHAQVRPVTHSNISDGYVPEEVEQAWTSLPFAKGEHERYLDDMTEYTKAYLQEMGLAMDDHRAERQRKKDRAAEDAAQVMVDRYDQYRLECEQKEVPVDIAAFFDREGLVCEEKDGVYKVATPAENIVITATQKRGMDVKILAPPLDNDRRSVPIRFKDNHTFKKPRWNAAASDRMMGSGTGHTLIQGSTMQKRLHASESFLLCKEVLPKELVEE